MHAQVSFTPAHPGWLVHVSSGEHYFSIPLAGWVTVEDGDGQWRVVPGWCADGEIVTAEEHQEVWAVAPGELVHNRDVLNWHNSHTERLARLRADRFAVPD